VSDALRSLESVQRQGADAAKTALAEARDGEARQTRRFAALATRRCEIERKIARAREQFAAADQVAGLRAAGRRLRGLQADLSQICGSIAEVQGQLASARAEVDAAEQALREAELGRRAVDGVLQRRELARKRASERRDEAEAEDFYRSRG
jgi:flagellar biosynthesis chaperone FliJ